MKQKQAQQDSIVILGGGPAGLGAAYRLAQRGRFRVTVVERNPDVGGNAGSFEVGGMFVDYGSHRLHPACDPEILADIRELLGEQLLDRPRHGRIHLRGRWLHFPLKPFDLMARVPPSFAAGVAWDAATKPLRKNGEETFACVLQAGLGRTICRDFYFPYARKIWGVAPDQLDAEQARRRVSAGSLTRLVGKVASSIPGLKRKGGGRFFYPKRGFGQISCAFRDAAESLGVQIRLNTSVTAVAHDAMRVHSVRCKDGDGGEHRLPAQHVLSTIPLPILVRSMHPGPSPEVLAATEKLRYRAMILIYLVIDQDQFTPYDAHYFPDQDIAITRISEPKHYGLAGCDGTTVLCAELPCDVDDEVWSMSDDQLAAVVQSDLERVGIPIESSVQTACTRRLRQAYPIYTTNYGQHFEVLDKWIGEFSGLTSLGRQGLFAHDNTHHTLATAYAACDCLDDQSRFDEARWREHRIQFESHVVED